MSDQHSIPPSFTRHGVHKFKNIYFYILDSPEPPENLTLNGGVTPRRRKETMHETKVNDIKERVGRYTRFKIIDVRLPQNQDVGALYTYFLQELHTKNENDLMIFYYYGQAGEKGREYAWKFDGPKHVWFNAYDIFELCGASGLAFLFLLDGDCVDLWPEKLDTPTGHVSIFARGGELKNPNREIMQDDGGFSESFADNLSSLAKDLPPKKKSLFTIANLITPPGALPTYRVRRIESVFKKPELKSTENIVIDPRIVRAQLEKKQEKHPEATFVKVDFYLRVTDKFDKGINQMGPPRRIKVKTPASTPTASLALLAPSIPDPTQNAAPTAVMVAPPTPPSSAAGAGNKSDASAMSMVSSGDEGYDSDESNIDVSH